MVNEQKRRDKMANRNVSRTVLCGLILLLLSSCAYPISKELRQESKESPPFAVVLSNPTAYVGSTVIWGGSIIQTLNTREGTDILILETPLNYEEMPEGKRYSQGRFMAKTSKYLDPEIYKVGRRITVAGEIIGKETRPLSNTEYTYPVVMIEQIHLWRKHWVYVQPYPYYWYGPGWWRPWPYGYRSYNDWGYWDDWDDWDD
jgi:outer membrane lipoprotein